MKTYKFLIISVCLIWSVSQLGCRASRGSSEKKTIITGTIDNVKDLSFEFSYDIYSLLQSTKREKVKIDSHGNFRIALNLNSPLKGTLNFGRDLINGRGHNKYVYTYLEPGDSLHIEADVDFTADTNIIQHTLVFSGTNADDNRFLNLADWTFNSYDQLRQNNYGFIQSLGPDTYKANVDSIRDEQIRFLRAYNDTVRISKQLYEIYRLEAINLASARKIAYPSGHRGFNKDKEFKLPDDYYGFMDSIEISENLENVGLPYMRFVHFYLRTKYNEAKKSGYEGDYISFLDTQLKKRPRYIYMAFSLTGDFNAEVYNMFGKGTPYADIKRIVKEKYGHLEGMLPGKPAPQVVLQDIGEGQLHSSEAFKGKYIYIDFWATWCKPCIKEIPDIVKLKEEYKGKNIEFVSISIDAGKQEWIDYVQKESLDGPQYWLDEKNKKIYSTSFNISMIPRFVLIDDEGKIIDANAPRPSSGDAIRKLLNTSLAKGSH